MHTLKSVWPLLDWHMVLVVASALLGTFVCRELDLLIDLPAELVSVAVVFPLVFSIAGAYTRREDALKNFATLKSSAVALYFAYRDWPDDDAGLGQGPTKYIHDLFRHVAAYFKAPVAGQPAALHDVYRVFSDLSRTNESLRASGVSATEISRDSQYQRDIIGAFESMRNFSSYRTPVTLRAFSRIFLSLFPVLFTPYFSLIGYPQHAWAGYVLAALYSMVLVGLDNIQEHLEDPYDSIGLDDLQLDVADEYVALIADHEPALGRTDLHARAS